MSTETTDKSEVFLADIIKSYKPPGGSSANVTSIHHPQHILAPCSDTEWVRNHDGSILLDHNGIPLSVARLLATKPLRHELSSRPGPGNKKLTYLSGEAVTRTLNDAFGFDGWNLEILSTTREHFQESDGRFIVAYTAQVRVTHRKTGTFKEDCGAGDATDRTAGTAIANALKASVTDAMKRAARHFGDKLGNSLYQGTFNINKAPNTLQQALDQYAIDRANTKFGVPTNQPWPKAKHQSEPTVYTAASRQIPVAEHMNSVPTLPQQDSADQGLPQTSSTMLPPDGQLSRNKSITIKLLPPTCRTSNFGNNETMSCSELTPLLSSHSTVVGSLQTHSRDGTSSVPIVTPSTMQRLATTRNCQDEGQVIGSNFCQETKPANSRVKHMPACNLDNVKRPETSTGLHQHEINSRINTTTPGVLRPPPTPGQQLHGSKLFGSNPSILTIPDKSNLENQPPPSVDDAHRPATSSGVHSEKGQNLSGMGPFACKKRGVDNAESREELPVKRCSITSLQRVSNPYA